MSRRGSPLRERLARLDDLLALGDGRLDPPLLAEAAAVRDKAAERLARGEEAVVVALCGGTGVGKSSLFNALAGAELSPVGVRRPVTTSARALVVGDGGGAVLDWLGVPSRDHVPPDGMPDGLVVLDLPDHDSVELDHRLVVDDLVERVDVLVWVVDPIKYAHASLHEGYLRRLAQHADVVVVVLNRIDELAPADRPLVVDDVRALLAADGLRDARVLATSAVTGEGIDRLRALLVEEGRARRAVVERLTADLRHLAGALDGPALGPDVAAAPSTDGLSDALAAAVGVEPTAAASAAEYRLAARGASRSVVLRPLAVLLALVLRPVRGLRGIFDRGGRERRQRASAQAGGATPLTVRHAALRMLAQLADGLPSPWAERLQTIAGAEDGRLVARVRAAVDDVPLRPPRRRWWRVVAVLRGMIDAVALVGALWLGGLGVLAWLRLPEPPTPMVTEVLSLPTALLLGALVVRLLVEVVHRLLVRSGAGRHRRAVARALRAAVRDVVEEEVARPLRAEVDAHAQLRRLVGQLTS